MSIYFCSIHIREEVVGYFECTFLQIKQIRVYYKYVSSLDGISWDLVLAQKKGYPMMLCIVNCNIGLKMFVALGFSKICKRLCRFSNGSNGSIVRRSNLSALAASGGPAAPLHVLDPNWQS